MRRLRCLLVFGLARTHARGSRYAVVRGGGTAACHGDWYAVCGTRGSSAVCRPGRTGRCRFAAIRGRSLRRYHGSGALRIGSAPLRSDPRTGRRALSDSSPCHPCRPRRSRSDLRRMDRGAAGRPWRISSRQLPCPTLLLRRDPFLCHRASDVTTDGSVPGNFEKMCDYPL